jgi:nicotinic acid mononucleotide adenylyltransferase
MKTYKQFLSGLNEAKTDGVTFTFGRFNPITKGHEENIKFLKDIAKKNNTKPKLYTSFSHDKKKNPLKPEDKIKYLEKFFDIEVNKDKKLNNAFKILEELAKDNKRVFFVVGEDRVQDFQSMKKYAKEWGIEEFDIIESGKRTKGVSGTQMREYAKQDNFLDFQKELPSKATTKEAKELFNLVKKGME